MRVCKSTHTLTDIRYRDNETDGCPSVATQAALRALQAQNRALLAQVEGREPGAAVAPSRLER